MSKIWRVHVWRNYIDSKLEIRTSFFGLISPHIESPNFWHFISQLGTVLYRNHKVPGRQGSAALEIQKIIESPLAYTHVGVKIYFPRKFRPLVELSMVTLCWTSCLTLEVWNSQKVGFDLDMNLGFELWIYFECFISYDLVSWTWGLKFGLNDWPWRLTSIVAQWLMSSDSD